MPYDRQPRRHRHSGLLVQEKVGGRNPSMVIWFESPSCSYEVPAESAVDAGQDDVLSQIDVTGMAKQLGLTRFKP